jgi:hypothetical protein
MPPLSEFLGHLMSEVVRARALADVESTRVAAMYAADPLLRHLTVPRFRLPDLTIDVPMVINRIDGASPPAQPQQPVERPTLRKLFETIVMEQLQRLGAKAKKSVLGELRKKVASLVGDDEGPDVLDVHGWGEQMLLRVLPQITQAFDVNGSLLETAIRTAWRAKFGEPSDTKPAPPSTEPSRIDVAFSPEELQSAGAANVTRFRLSVKESGVEWLSVERDGEVERRLVAE